MKWRFLALLFLAPLAVSPARAQAPKAEAARTAPTNSIHLEAEDAVLTGVTAQTAQPGFSGTGYVGDFAGAGSKIVWTIPNARAGLYQAQIRVLTPSGAKGYDLVVNGHKSSGMLSDSKGAFITQSAGKVELTEGANTVEIDRGWGYYDVDALDLTPAPPPAPLAPVSATLSDPKATPEARALMQTLVRLYGTKTLSGQYEPKDNAYVQAITGKTPAIYGGDLIDYSPSRVAHGTKPEGTTEAIIKEAKAGQIVTLTWHWNAPSGLVNAVVTDKNGKPVDDLWYKGFYTEATTFDVQKALDDPESIEYALLIRDMDVIAVQLQKLQAAHVPVLWRPLHEAQGGWFWWGAKGQEPFKKLWRLMHDRLVNVHGLHNLIWVDCSGLDPKWYPGDDVVDVIGIDAYPSDPADTLDSAWDTLEKQYGGRKLIALTEFGGVPDVAHMQQHGVRWSYFVSWTGDVGPHKMTVPELKRLYNEPVVGTR